MSRCNRHGKRMASVLDNCRPNWGVGELKLLAATSDAESPPAVLPISDLELMKCKRVLAPQMPPLPSTLQ